MSVCIAGILSLPSDHSRCCVCCLFDSLLRRRGNVCCEEAYSEKLINGQSFSASHHVIKIAVNVPPVAELFTLICLRVSSARKILEHPDLIVEMCVIVYWVIFATTPLLTADVG